MPERSAQECLLPLACMIFALRDTVWNFLRCRFLVTLWPYKLDYRYWYTIFTMVLVHELVQPCEQRELRQPPLLCRRTFEALLNRKMLLLACFPFFLKPLCHNYRQVATSESSWKWNYHKWMYWYILVIIDAFDVITTALVLKNAF